MKDNQYQPPKVWTENNESGGVWSKINRPTAGARFDATLPVGKHPLQLYSLATPNGQKVTILFGRCLALATSICWESGDGLSKVHGGFS